MFLELLIFMEKTSYMKIKLTESEINDMLTEALVKVLRESCDEEMEEGFFSDIVDRGKAVRDTLKNGGSYNAHFANNQLQRSRNDIERLKSKYGYEGGNGRTYVNSQIEQTVAEINRKYDEKIQQINAQRDAEISKATGKAQKRWNEFSSKKQELTKQKNRNYMDRQKAMNNNPYSNFR